MTNLTVTCKIQLEVVMNTIKLSIPGKAGHQIEMQATYSELKEYYHFLRGVEHRMYSDGPEWLINMFEVLEDKYTWS